MTSFKEERKKKTFVSLLPVSDFRMLTLTGRDNVDSGVAKDLSTKATVFTVFLYNFTLKYIKKLNIQEISIWH